VSRDEVRLRPYGDTAVLVELGSTDRVVAWSDALRALDSPLVAESVPAAETLLVLAAPGVASVRVRDLLRDLVREWPPAADDDLRDAGARPLDGQEEIEIVVRYDGPDLADVARLTGLSAEEVVRAHTGTPWRVAFGGFAPGFGYLVGGDPRLEVPRRDEARTRVPAGAVGLAGTFSGVYPRESPGGWQLIGTTDAVLWDLDREPPALLRAGATVRFVEAGR